MEQKNSDIVLNEDDRKFIRRVKEFMQHKNWNQKDLAAACGCTPSNISDIFTKGKKLGHDIVNHLKANVPELSLDWWFAGVGDMLVNKSESKKSDSNSKFIPKTDRELAGYYFGKMEDSNEKFDKLLIDGFGTIKSTLESCTNALSHHTPGRDNKEGQQGQEQIRAAASQ